MTDRAGGAGRADRTGGADRTDGTGGTDRADRAGRADRGRAGVKVERVKTTPRGGSGQTVRIADGIVDLWVLDKLKEAVLGVPADFTVSPENENQPADVLIRNIPKNRQPNLELDGEQVYLNLPRTWRLTIQNQLGN